MPDKKASTTTTDPDAVLPLQEWIRLLTGQGASMRAAMAFAAKGYKEHNTRAKLASLTSEKINELVSDKDMRKAVWNAVKGVSSGQSPQKKRARDDDLLRPLGGDTREVPESFEFNEIRDPEALLAVSVTVNRAPIKTAWAYCVARRLGFDVEESLSLAHVYVHIGSLKHALSLGNILNAQETRDAENEIRELPGESDYHVPGKRKREEVEEKKVGSSQPWVGLLRSNPVIERPDGTWRAIQKGVPVEPSVAYLYITRALKTFTPHVMGAMQLVAESYSPEELDAVGLALYNDFKPDVVNWGQRGSVSVAKILDQIKGPVDGKESSGATNGAEDETEDAGTEKEKGESGKDVKFKNVQEDETEDTATTIVVTPNKKSKLDDGAEALGMSLEEYEAMLDAEEFDESLYEGL